MVVLVAVLSMLIGSQALTAPLAVAAAPMSSVGITKTNDADGPLEPGDEFIYTISGQCSGLDVDCVNFTVTDTLPEGLEVTSLPKSNSTRDVTYDEATRQLTIVYKQPLQNPEGETGLRAGQAGSVEIGMRVPADTRWRTAPPSPTPRRPKPTTRTRRPPTPTSPSTSRAWSSR